MEHIELAEDTIGEAVERANEVLSAGGVLLYPTDTLYGLGADAFSDKAVDLVYRIKGRDEGKPIHCVVADMKMAAEYAEVGNDALLLAREFLPGPLTLILKKKKGVEGGIARRMHTIGIRIPDNEFCLSLASEFGKPFTTTSANPAGGKSFFTIEKILAQLSDAAEQISLAIDAGELPQRKPSTVVDLSGEEPVILREGAIAAADIWKVLQEEI